MGLLSLADHAIVTYGTFGMWGALLAGRGETIMPKDSLETEVGMAIKRANIPNWTFI
jgi:hypothetical protein